MGEIEVIGEPLDYTAAALCELDEPLEPDPSTSVSALRTVLDRRGEGPLAVLADAIAASDDHVAADGTDGPVRRVLAICADVPRRLPGLRERTGEFALVSYDGLVRAPGIGQHFTHIVVLDPPPAPARDELIRTGTGYTHLAWGEAELRFAEQMHELEYGLRSSLVALYRNLKVAGRASGEELERLLRGDGPHERPARMAGRLVRVLTELELVSLDRDLPALAIAGAQRTELERSSAFRAYSQRYEDGRRFLNRATPRRRT